MKIGQGCAIISILKGTVWEMIRVKNRNRMNRPSRFSLKILFKWLGIVFLLAAYLAASGFISAFPVGARRRRELRTRNTSFFSSRALALFGVRVQMKHGERLNSGVSAKERIRSCSHLENRDSLELSAGSFNAARNGCLLISNHVSYIDVLVISSLAPSVFITSVELKNTPLLGILARFGGSLFVERRKPSGLKKEIIDISKVLAQGFTVVLFPEGTTSNGDGVQEFKNSLFDAAVSAGVDILPVCLRYTRINGKTVSGCNKDRVFYYGGVSFSNHFPEFMSLTSIDVEVLPLRRITVNGDASRKKLATSAYEAIAAAYRHE